ncbi:glycosyltransferase family 4 protein [Geobacter pickeringii]|uniref:Glycosyl transferase n=1 Tax=Geobacter pickeringii TaxID=345632 RepID=A0A0B5B9K2_9BACT|nr:MraY family glycosyltransferase [Geobacter pickeringii]AJE03257.1 glycosyl transferase [Geobacter pickeringii]
MFLSTLLLSVLITIVLTPAFCSVAIRYQVVDLPNERKVHQQPIPRIGGVAMAIGAFVPIVLWHMVDSFVRAYLCGSAILVLIGLVDDFRDLSPRVKFAGQFAAALMLVLFGGVEITRVGTLAPDGFALAPWLSVPLTLVTIVGVTNAINLADGLDGLAGGICLLIFAAIGYLAYLVDQPVTGFIALALSGVIYGFLRFNTHPASIFMGDAGSQFLGYSAIALLLRLSQGNTALSPLLPLVMVGFPVLDTLVVMSLRISRGVSPFSADKNHFHHHLMRLGFTHAESVLVIYIFQTVLIIAAILFRYYSDWVLLLGYLLFSLMLIAGFSLAANNKMGFRILGHFRFRVGSLLRLWRREGTIIRHAFRIFEYGIPLLLALTCMIAVVPWRAASFIGPFLALVILVVRFIRPGHLGAVIRFSLYLAIPFAVYFSDMILVGHHPALPVRIYNASFGVLAVCIIVISKLSRRSKGFQSTPLDFLIIILAVVLPNLPYGGDNHAYQPGLIAAKIIMLYFSFEVLMAEMRGNFVRLSYAVAGALTLLAL